MLNIFNVMDNSTHNKPSVAGAILGIVAGSTSAIVAYVLLEVLRDRRLSKNPESKINNPEHVGDLEIQKGVTTRK